ncbi:PSME3-interacting protein [Geodia barretti]|uniref:PSME3-interacting protein n=1 Tax=Geodia barretti TaxID=519541 RepID=A0AA35W3S3_GEOBA|nr:PSME3-interacting protein [Geodia barretti]
MQFISEKEVDEIKAKKQKEWEQVRRSDQPLERPEEAIDNRTLYEKLKAQKNQKQEEFEEQFKFSESQYYYLQYNNVSQLNCGTL